MPARHGRPAESLMTTPTSTPEPRPQPVAQRRRGRVGVDRQQRQLVGVHVGQVDAGRRDHQAVPGLRRCAAARGPRPPARTRPRSPPAGPPRASRDRSRAAAPGVPRSSRWPSTSRPGRRRRAGRARWSAISATRSSPGRSSADAEDGQHLDAAGCGVIERRLRHRRARAPNRPWRRWRRRRSSAGAPRGPATPAISAWSVSWISHPSRTPVGRPGAVVPTDRLPR